MDPQMVVVDSIQTMRMRDVSGSPGSVTQVSVRGGFRRDEGTPTPTTLLSLSRTCTHTHTHTHTHTCMLVHTFTRVLLPAPLVRSRSAARC
jgi:hypothetical protein